MNTEEKKDLLKKITEDVLNKMSFQHKVTISNGLNNNASEKYLINIESPDSKFIIGKKGANLIALQHILKLIVNTRSEDYINFTVDVNHYRQQQDNYLKNLAREMAQEVIINGRAMTLEPMNGYERRIIHLELEKNENVKTESIGEGENRKIVISPIGEKF